MDGREAMAFHGSAPYYLHRGAFASPPAPQGGGAFHAPPQAPPGLRPFSNQNMPSHTHVGSTFSVNDPRPSSFSHDMSTGMSSTVQPAEQGKKKRGRPRKYAPDGQVSLGLSPLPAKPKPTSGSDPHTPKRARGRPPGTGRKQRLANLGEWMNSSAGMAFAPHVIKVGAGEDIVSKILSFAQQRPRALCILSGTGAVSSVTLRQPASTVPSAKYEGRFEILCLSGSYLVAEEGGPKSRLGGLSASLSSPEGHVIGGGVGTLIAASLVQVVACSFVYGGGSKNYKSKQEASEREDNKNGDSVAQQTGERSAAVASTPAMPQPTRNITASPVSGWSGYRPIDSRNPHMDIDLTRG